MKRRISRRFQPTMTPGLGQLESRQLLSSGFQVVPTPTVTGSSFSAVSAVSPTDIWAVGSDSAGPLIENFNGTSWSKVTAPKTGGALNGVSALSSSAVWAVGESSSGPLVEFFNGKSWSVQTTPTISGGGGILNAVTAISATDVWAVGGSKSGDLIENFNGTSWSIVQAPATSGSTPTLTGISAASPTDIFAVGSVTKGNQLLQFNGTTWTAPATQIAGSAATKAVDAIATNDVWVVGGAGIWNFNGATWSQVAFPNATLSAISGFSANNIFAVGTSFSATNGLATGFGTAAEQWNGTSWSAVTSANPGSNQDGLVGVATQSNGTVVAVGNASPGGGIIESATFNVSPPVTPIVTTTALTAAPGSATFGAPVTFTATITPASTGTAAPTGAVDFFSGSTLLGSGTVSNDTAAITTTALTLGTNSITAEYLGDPNYVASTSPDVTVTTTQATTTTAVSFSPASPVLGQSVTLTATITPETTGPASPTGTVEFLDGSTVLGSGTVSSGVATLITTALPLGTSSITATYEGDTNYAGSTSAADSVTVVASVTPPSGSLQIVPSPIVTGSSFSAVSAVSPTDIWAVGSDSTGPLIENFNGTSWSVVAAPAVQGGTLTGVTTLSSNAVWAVGSTLSSTGVFTPLVEFFNGTSWTVQSTPTLPKNGNANGSAGGGEFNAVTAISPTDVWAVGGLGNGRGGNLIENFNGTSWNVVPAPASDGSISASLSAISAVSSTDIWAVGSVPKGNQLLQFNGTTWSAVSSQIVGSAATKAVDAISATDVWVTGGAGIWNFNGTIWSRVASPNATLVAISGRSANNVFAVGSGFSSTNGLVTGFGTVAEQWNGTSWSAVTTVNPGANQDGLTGVATLSNGTVVAVGNASPGGGIIESNATTAAPVSTSSVSGILPNNTVKLPARSTVRIPVRVISPNGTAQLPAASTVPVRVIWPDGTTASPETNPVRVLAGDVLDVLPNDISQPPAAPATRRR